jgi:hypothetical protein
VTRGDPRLQQFTTAEIARELAFRLGKDERRRQAGVRDERGIALLPPKKGPRPRLRESPEVRGLASTEHMDPPTDRQLDYLRAIADFTDEHGFPPTIREICILVGVLSNNAVGETLRALRRKGLLMFVDRTARSIELTAAGFAAIEPPA